MNDLLAHMYTLNCVFVVVPSILFLNPFFTWKILFWFCFCVVFVVAPGYVSLGGCSKVSGTPGLILFAVPPGLKLIVHDGSILTLGRMDKGTKKRAEAHIFTLLETVPGSSGLTLGQSLVSSTELHGAANREGRLGWIVFLQGGLMPSYKFFYYGKRGKPALGTSQQSLAQQLSLLL